MSEVESLATWSGPRLEAELSALLSPDGSPPELAEQLATWASGRKVSELLLRCLRVEPGRSPEETLGCSQGKPFTRMQALIILVRLLGTETGDLSGDTVSMPPEDAASLSAHDDSVARFLRTEPLIKSVVDLLARHIPRLHGGALDPYLRLEALRALRLQLLPLPRGGPPRWWVEERIGHRTRSSARRELVDVLLQVLTDVGDGMCHRPKIAALGGLRSLVAASPECRSHFFLTGGARVAVEVLHSQIRLPAPPVEAALIGGCELLSALVKGPRSNARQLVELGAHNDATECMRRWKQHREVATAAFALLTALASDPVAAARISCSTQEAHAATAVRERWPDDAEEALDASLRRTVHSVREHALPTLVRSHGVAQRFRSHSARMSKSRGVSVFGGGAAAILLQ